MPTVPAHNEDSSRPVPREKLFERIAEGTLVLTAGTRLSRALLGEYEAWMRTSGHRAWPTPALLPWQAWLQQLWESASLHSLQPLPLVLQEDQARMLWQQVVAEEELAVLHEHALVEQLQKSWQLLHEWQLSLEDPRFDDNSDSAAFRRLAREFRRRCRSREVITRAEIPGQLAELLENGMPPLPGDIVLLGFNLLTPSQRALLDALARQAVEVQWLHPEGRQSSPRLCQARDSREELALACAWARERLLENPRLRLGIVVPDLQNRYGEVLHSLHRTLEPPSLLPAGEPSRRSWNISLGRPLAGFPPVAAALQLLHLLSGHIHMDALEALLRSPHVACTEEDERFQRALLLRRLRERGRESCSLGDLLHTASQVDPQSGEPRPWYCPALVQALKALKEQKRELGRQPLPPPEWAERFGDWLRAAGWMAGTRLDSIDYQVVERWKRLLGAFRGLELVVPKLSLEEALRTLAGMARRTLFQPRGPAAPLQVLGLFEATALAFDGLWIMGMEETAWPPAPDPDPFIPLSLQRQLQMPGSDSARELQLARAMIDGFRGAAGEVIFSHALAEGTEALETTPLLEGLPRLKPEELGLRPFDEWEREIARSRSMETVEEDPAPPVSGKVLGGAALFRHQALCPFRAFAEHRLGAAAFPSVHTGLDAAQRGSLLHRSLELFWGAVKNRERLLAMDDTALPRQVELAVSGALADFERRQPGLLGARARNIEAKRLAGLLLKWLETEKQRPPFEVVAREKRVTGRRAGVEYRLYIDRIDRLEDGRQVLIDYKTGQVSPAAWFGPRPADPQLPLYSTCLDPAQVAAVTFAELRPGSSRFRGVVAGKELLPGLPPGQRGNGELRQATEEWPQVLHQWQQVIDELAARFSEGDAEVDPKRGEQTCNDSWCELGSLCRFHERNREEPGDG